MNPLVEEIEWATGLNGETLIRQLADHGLAIVWAAEEVHPDPTFNSDEPSEELNATVELCGWHWSIVESLSVDAPISERERLRDDVAASLARTCHDCRKANQ